MAALRLPAAAYRLRQIVRFQRISGSGPVI
jgi:hypothetical protein